MQPVCDARALHARSSRRSESNLSTAVSSSGSTNCRPGVCSATAAIIRASRVVLPASGQNSYPRDQASGHIRYTFPRSMSHCASPWPRPRAPSTAQRRSGHCRAHRSSASRCRSPPESRQLAAVRSDRERGVRRLVWIDRDDHQHDHSSSATTVGGRRDGHADFGFYRPLLSHTAGGCRPATLPRKANPTGGSRPLSQPTGVLSTLGCRPGAWHAVKQVGLPRTRTLAIPTRAPAILWAGPPGGRARRPPSGRNVPPASVGSGAPRDSLRGRARARRECAQRDGLDHLGVALLFANGVNHILVPDDYGLLLREVETLEARFGSARRAGRLGG